MLTHNQLKAKLLQRPGVKRAYDALEQEYALARQLIVARTKAGLTQEQVALRMETKAPAIARLESAGKHSPSVATLRKYATAVGYDLQIKLVPARRTPKSARRATAN